MRFLSLVTLTACFNIYVSAIFTPWRSQLCTVSLLTGNFSHPSDFWNRSRFLVCARVCAGALAHFFFFAVLPFHFVSLSLSALSLLSSKFILFLMWTIYSDIFFLKKSWLRLSLAGSNIIPSPIYAIFHIRRCLHLWSNYSCKKKNKKMLN